MDAWLSPEYPGWALLAQLAGQLLGLLLVIGVIQMIVRRVRRAKSTQ